MLELKSLPTETERGLRAPAKSGGLKNSNQSELRKNGHPSGPPYSDPPKNDPQQRRLMIVALGLLLVALMFVLYRDRDFWYPESQEADTDQPADQTPATAAQHVPIVARALPGAGSAPAATTAKSAKSFKTAKAKTKSPAPPAPAANTNPNPASPSAPPAMAVSNRTVLPPLEVEVVAGDNHKTLRPGSNSVRVDLQPGTVPHADVPVGASVGGNDNSETAARVTSNAAERVQMSADTTDILTHPVQPGYPLLARQMKVQGSVILRALISKDGAIQDLHVMSGPPILATAAEDAVRQWRFRPHYLGNEAVETQAKITVNFTISTN